jgi:hypothetical protein
LIVTGIESGTASSLKRLMSSLAALPSTRIGRFGSRSQMMPPYWWF